MTSSRFRFASTDASSYQAVTLLLRRPCTSTCSWSLQCWQTFAAFVALPEFPRAGVLLWFLLRKAHRRALLRRSQGAAQPCQRVGSACTARPGLVLLNSDCQPRGRVAVLVQAQSSGKQALVRVREKEAASPGRVLRCYIHTLEREIALCALCYGDIELLRCALSGSPPLLHLPSTVPSSTSIAVGQQRSSYL